MSDNEGRYGLVRVERALLSVSDKTSLAPFASFLAQNSVELISTGGTFKALSEAGLSVRKISDFTGFPEILDGRVKTLHPKVEGGLLADWSNQAHAGEAKANNIVPIHLIVCNLYPFEKTVASGAADRDVIENIDIGGPTMVRAAAKNYKNTAVVTSPAQYSLVQEELSKNSMGLSLETRESLARQAFSLTAGYDAAIANWFESGAPAGGIPQNLFIALKGAAKPKYGENPGQNARVFKTPFNSGGILEWEQLSGDVPSFNNFMDAGKANKLLQGFEEVPTVATVKHGIISGFSFATTLSEAYEKTSKCDPSADFGGVIVMNRACDAKTAELIADPRPENYREIICAPDFAPEAVELLKKGQKKQRRLFKTKPYSSYHWDVRLVDGAFLVQEQPDFGKRLQETAVSFPTKLKPDADALKVLLTAHEVVRKVPSNGILVGDGVVKDGIVESFWTYGVGSSTKRSRAVQIALEVAGGRARNAILASDGFFPFPDSVELAGERGVKAIIQPGGSLRDHLSIQKADQLGIAMAFSHARIFSH